MILSGGRRAFPGEAFGEPPGLGAQTLYQRRRVGELYHAGCERFDIAMGNQETGFALANRVAQSRTVRCHRRCPACRRFDDGDAPAFFR